MGQLRLGVAPLLQLVPNRGRDTSTPDCSAGDLQQRLNLQLPALNAQIRHCATHVDLVRHGLKL